MVESRVESKLAETIALLKHASKGDPAALNALYARYGDRLLAVARLRLGPKLRAKLQSVDVVQDAMLASLRGISDLKVESSGAFMHWFSKLIENRIRDLADHFAAKRRDAGREQPLDPLRPTEDSLFGPIAELATVSTPSKNAARQEDLERLECAVDGLPQDQREALILIRYEGLTLSEAGDIMNRSTDAVRMLVARAIVNLGKAMTDLNSHHDG